MSRVLFQVVCTGGTVFLYHTSFCKTGPFFVQYRVPNLNKGSQVFLQGQWRLAAPGSPLLRLCQGAKEAQKNNEEEMWHEQVVSRDENCSRLFNSAGYF